jgi:hypothetical protein
MYNLYICEIFVGMMYILQIQKEKKFTALWLALHKQPFVHKKWVAVPMILWGAVYKCGDRLKYSCAYLYLLAQRFIQ